MTSIAAAAKVPPKFVVKAICDYKSASPIELSVRQGDFFMVTTLNPLSAASLRPPPVPPALSNRALPEALRGADLWIEVTDPIRNLKDVVPTAYMDILERTGHAKQTTTARPLNVSPQPLPTFGRQPKNKTPTRTSSSANAADDVARIIQGLEGSPPAKFPPKPTPPSNPTSSVYPAVVQYDFNPEQMDELKAAAGDNVLVLAHSGLDWVVAKFIDKLGNPGMIPVNFLLIRDPTTNQPIRNFQEVLRQGNVLTYKQWRAKEQARSQRTIALGVLSTNENIVVTEPVASSKYGLPLSEPKHVPSSPSPTVEPTTPQPKPEAHNRSLRSSLSITSVPSTPLPTHNAITSVSILNVEYRPDAKDSWFQIFVSYATGTNNTLFRRYDNFADMHSDLSYAIEGVEELERTTRVLPRLPLRSESVSEELVGKRKLESYLQALVASPSYILQHEAVLHFFKPRSGDSMNSSAPLISTPPQITQSTSSEPAKTETVKSDLPAQGLGIASLPAASPAMLKIKVVHGSDIMAIRCNPQTITLNNLLTKIASKLFQDDLDAISRLLWRQTTGAEAGTYVELESEEAFQDVVASASEKLVIYVQ